MRRGSLKQDCDIRSPLTNSQGETFDEESKRKAKRKDVFGRNGSGGTRGSVRAKNTFFPPAVHVRKKKLLHAIEIEGRERRKVSVLTMFFINAIVQIQQ